MSCFHRIFPLLCLIGLILSGCMDIEDTWTLNPDGSGKVVHHAVFQAVSFNLTDSNQPSDPEEDMKDAVLKTLEDSAGVDAWENINFKLRDDGKIDFTGTAYFPDIKLLKIKTGNMTFSGIQPVFKTDTQGKVTLTMSEPAHKDPEPADSTPKSPEELKAAVKKGAAEFQQMKPMLQGFLSQMQITHIFHLPGQYESSTNFEKLPDGGLRILFSGDALLKAMDTLIKDPEWMAEQIAQNVNFQKDGPAMEGKVNEILFGNPAAPQAVFTGANQPAFDYKKAVATAQKKYPDMLKALGLVSTSSPAIELASAATGSGLTKVEIGGLRLIQDFGMSQSTFIMNQQPGFTVALVGTFSGRVLGVDSGQLTEAVDSTGKSLMPKNDFGRRINFPNISEDGTQAIFDVNMEIPSKDATHIRIVAGELVYLTGTTTAEKDLGLPYLKDKAKGKEFGAEIESLGKSKWQTDKYEIQFKVKLSNDRVKNIRITDASGKDLKIERSGSSYSDTSSSYSLVSEQPFPENGKIILEVYEDVKKYKAPFRVENFDFQGQPHQP